MARKKCAHCKRFMKAKSLNPICPRCRGVVKPKPKRKRNRRGKRLSGDAVAHMRYCHDYLRCHPCIDCGETDIIVLQFDHVRGRKRGNVTSLARSHSLVIVKAEIAKCEVRCANCHVRKTAREQGWYKAREAS